MANVVNGTTGAFGQVLLHPGWDQAASFELRSRPLFRQFVQKRVVDPTNRSNVYYMPVHTWHQVAEDRHEVDEVVSPDQVAAPPSYYVRIRIKEHGYPVGRTELLDNVSYIPVDPILAAQMGDHMANTLDEMAADHLYSGLQVRSNGHEPNGDDLVVSDTLVPFTQVVSTGPDGATNFGYNPETGRDSLGADNTIHSNATARIVARLRSASAVPMRGSQYVGILHPDAAVDYQDDAGSSIQWHEPHKYVDTSNIYVGEVGTYRGVAWIEHPRARVIKGAGAGERDVYQTIVMGREVLAEHVVREPGPGLSPTLDTFNRHRTIYWYGTLGFAIFRQEPLWRIEHTVSF